MLAPSRCASLFPGGMMGIKFHYSVHEWRYMKRVVPLGMMKFFLLLLYNKDITVMMMNICCTDIKRSIN